MTTITEHPLEETWGNQEEDLREMKKEILALRGIVSNLSGRLENFENQALKHEIIIRKLEERTCRQDAMIVKLKKELETSSVPRFRIRETIPDSTKVVVDMTPPQPPGPHGPKSFVEAAKVASVMSQPKVTVPAARAGSRPSAGAPASEPRSPQSPTASRAPETEEWTTVGPKGSKMREKPTPAERQMPSLLRKQVPPEERTEEVVKVVLKLPLTPAARASPVSSWRKILKKEFKISLTPLHISLVNPEVGEVSLCATVAGDFKRHLAAYLVDPRPLGAQDLERRARSYLGGFFKPLRRSALVGFDRELQMRVLDRAQELAEQLSTSEARRWRHHVQSDRDWVNQSKE